MLEFNWIFRKTMKQHDLLLMCTRNLGFFIYMCTNNGIHCEPSLPRHKRTATALNGAAIPFI